MSAKDCEILDKNCHVSEIVISLAFNFSLSSIGYYIISNFHQIKLKDRINEVGPVYGSIFMAIAITSQIIMNMLKNSCCYSDYTWISKYFCHCDFIFNAMMITINCADRYFSSREENPRDIILKLQGNFWRVYIVIPALVIGVFHEYAICAFVLINLIMHFVEQKQRRDVHWWKKTLSYLIRARMTIVVSIEMVYFVLDLYGYKYPLPSFIHHAKATRGILFLIIHELVQKKYIKI